jgi:SAM-dependent methyltransferase
LTRSFEGQDVRSLDREAESRFAPGTNVKGAVGGANWCFLLPSLHLGRIVCLGCPSPAALATLSKLGDEVVVCASAQALRNLGRLLDPAGSRAVALIETTPHGAAPLPDRSANLVVVAGLPALRRHARAGYLREARRLLEPDGVAYFEGRFLRGIEAAALLWLAPAAGEVQMAAPSEDRLTIAFLERNFMNRRVLRRQLLRRPGRVLARQPIVTRIARRRGALVGPPSKRLGAEPPDYIRAIASNAGVEVEASRWALAAPGDYPSQKVLLFLFGSAGDSPESVIKITRDPELNPRLENEWRALTILREHGVGIDETVPRPLFLGSHRGLAVLGESAIAGVPFRERTRSTADCVHARAAVEWLLDLATATVSRNRSNAGTTPGELDAVFAQFEQIYRLEASERGILGGHVAALERRRDELPLVFQHGDPGPWNVLITPDGRPAFLDWEAAEPEGMPLWDLFHFLRSYSLQVSRAAGTRDPLQSFAEQFLEESAFNRLLVDATTRFCARTGLAAELVEPLFYTCWMHRGLKEAATLPPHRVDGGRYVSILRLALERRDSPGLRRLFSQGAANTLHT